MIEKATVEDVDALMADLSLMYEEMAPFGAMDYGKCVEFLTDSIEKHAVLIAKSDKDGSIIGHMGLRVETHWYTSDFALYEYYIYVKPEFRKTRAAFKLYDAAKAIAKMVNLPFFYGTFRKPESDFQRVDKFLRHQGGVQIGSTYFWEGD